MNQITVTGNLTKEPERFSTANGGTLAKFTVAVNDYDTTVFLPVIAFKNLADNCMKYLAKGSKVLVIGKLQVNEYKNDEKHLLRPEILANQVEFLTPKGDSDLPFPEVKSSPKPSNVDLSKLADPKQTPEVLPDDLPF